MKTFLLGVGAQKAGTTWLHRYINSYENADLGFAKEYHIWDAIHCPECERFKVTSRFPVRPNKFRRWRMQRSQSYYFDYFERRLAADNINITADITPSYTCLSEPVFRRIFEEFERRGITVKVVLLMRDPIQRCWSTVSMHRRKGKPKDGIDVEAPEEEALRHYFRSPRAQIRTRYDRTIKALEAAIPPERICYALYEELFTESEIERLSRFLNLSPRYEFTDNRFNISPRSTELSPATMAEVAEEYHEVYQYCANRFPQTESLWTGNDFI